MHQVDNATFKTKEYKTKRMNNFWSKGEHSRSVNNATLGIVASSSRRLLQLKVYRAFFKNYSVGGRLAKRTFCESKWTHSCNRVTVTTPLHVNDCEILEVYDMLG